MGYIVGARFPRHENFKRQWAPLFMEKRPLRNCLRTKVSKPILNMTRPFNKPHCNFATKRKNEKGCLFCMLKGEGKIQFVCILKIVLRVRSMKNRLR